MRQHRFKTVRALATGTAATIAVLIPLAAPAADAEAIIVTATRQPERAGELLADISVITREEIENAGQSTIEELLARQPGVEYASSGGPGQGSGIGIRGANSSHTLLLIDGQRVGSATYGVPNFSRLPLAQIERIEILRGPASALYGADAIGGVIQVFTKRGEGPASISASTGYGSYGTSDSSIGVAGGNDLVSYSLQAGYFETRGFNSMLNPNGTGYNADRDGFHNRSVSGSFALRPAAGNEVGLNFFSANGSNQFDSVFGPPAHDWSNEQEVSSFSLYSRNRISADWLSTLRVGRTVDDWTERKDGIASDVYRTDQDQASWQNDIRLPVGRALLAAEYLRQQVSSTSTYVLGERSIRSVLAGWSGSLGDHRVQLNVRRDENSQFGGRTTSFAAYGYQISADWRAHISHSTAFRAPTFNNLYFPQTCYPGYGCYGGNPNLKPETSRNTEVGANWEKDGQRFSLTHFRNKVTDLIDASLPMPMNVDQATLSGTSIAYTGSLGALAGGLAIDLQRARDDITGKRLAHRADRQLKAHLAWTSGPLRVGGEWQVSGARFEDQANDLRLGGYALVNLFSDYRLDREWTLFARANNVFDKSYVLATDRLSGDYATAGANVFVGVRYQQK